MMRALAVAAGVLLATAAAWADAGPARVGSKSFTESYLLGEIVARLAEEAGEVGAARRFGLGGTGIVYRALETGEIDVYPEYTGTISRAILGDATRDTPAAMREPLRRRGLVVSAPLGFENTYALAVREEMAAGLGLRTLGDLARHPTLRAAFTSGFLERDDGWPGLSRHYGLRLTDVRAIEHALAYPALAAGQVDVIDAFSTDGRLTEARFRLLEDDRRFFPSYAAVLLARQSFVDRAPRTWAAIERRLAGAIDTATMTRLNARVDLGGESVERAAADYLGGAAPLDGRHRVAREVLALTLDHLGLVAISVAAAILAGIPLGIVAARYRLLGQLELVSVGVVQTIPSLALLCFMIPLFGIGKAPALVALSLYALLPIVRGAYTGVITLDRPLMEMTGVLGLHPWQRLVRIELPLASVAIMSGIKTAAVVTVGTATLAAFIGGGGYGTLIVRGLAMNDVTTILAGAIPAAAMALLIHGAFELLDRVVIPRALR
jgi:osmoprotectant transport system permease protein